MMKQLEFISGMKKLSGFYFKDITNDQLLSWYEMFKDVSSEVFYKAIDEIAKNNKYMPSAGELYDICSKLNKNYLCDLAHFMFQDGYFHRGTKSLSDEQANRNLDKTIMWLENGIIPEFLKEDMQAYMTKFKKSLINSKKELLEHKR